MGCAEVTMQHGEMTDSMLMHGMHKQLNLAATFRGWGIYRSLGMW